MISPTVGRVVWYYPKNHQPDQPPLAALVARVWSDTCVNLAVFDGNGAPHRPGEMTSVLLVQEGAEVPSGGHYCTWMPYQIGQAAKTEQLQRQLKPGSAPA
jgi:hypothetical protein